MLDHVGIMPSSVRVVRARTGWAAVIRLGQEELMADGAERPIGEIAEALERRLRQALAQVALIGRDRTHG